jgi:hypothetical protein
MEPEDINGIEPSQEFCEVNVKASVKMGKFGVG